MSGRVVLCAKFIWNLTVGSSQVILPIKCLDHIVSKGGCCFLAVFKDRSQHGEEMRTSAWPLVKPPPVNSTQQQERGCTPVSVYTHLITHQPPPPPPPPSHGQSAQPTPDQKKNLCQLCKMQGEEYGKGPRRATLSSYIKQHPRSD